MYFCMYFRARFLVQMFTTTVPARCLYNARRFYRRTNLPTNREIAVPCGFHSANFAVKYMWKKANFPSMTNFRILSIWCDCLHATTHHPHSCKILYWWISRCITFCTLSHHLHILQYILYLHINAAWRHWRKHSNYIFLRDEWRQHSRVKNVFEVHTN